MYVTKKQMDEINDVQLKILKEFISVCNKLELKYYLVHGSLLGAIRYKGFFPFDDDIDIAMPRKDYDLFINQGQSLLENNLFIQTHQTEKNFPLVFAKIRNSNTTFLQPILDGMKVNKGIYIDIFPIDNYPTNKITAMYLKIKEKIYKIRVMAEMKKKRTLIKQLICNISKIIIPSFQKAMLKLENLYLKVPNTGRCILYGGKKVEQNLEASIFGEGEIIEFEKIKVLIPQNYKKYLNIIYGDYETFSPPEKYMRENNEVEISASIIDVNKSYKEYEKM